MNGQTVTREQAARLAQELTRTTHRPHHVLQTLNGWRVSDRLPRRPYGCVYSFAPVDETPIQ